MVPGGPHRDHPPAVPICYDRLQRLLPDELGVVPGAQTRRSHGAIVGLGAQADSSCHRRRQPTAVQHDLRAGRRRAES